MDLQRRRQRMLEADLPRSGVHDPAVLAAMARVPREAFVPQPLQARAYDDGPLPIGLGQTISQPAMVAIMTQLLELRPDQRVLEVGTGSGYQTALLAELSREVYTVEVRSDLAARARAVLEELGYENIHFRVGDGFSGWDDDRFDAIVLTAAPERLPRRLIDQLADGGRLVAPVGDAAWQVLVRLRREGGRILEEEHMPVRFVPMVHAGRRE
jgi:protein-L-isoaspartate(D-aspartate) O-methyltransferase